MLVFVHSRKETAKTARFIKEEALRNDTLARFLQVLPPTLTFMHTACPCLQQSQPLQALQSEYITRACSFC